MNKPKLAGLELTGDGRIGNQVVMDLDELGSFIEIPLYKNEERREQGKTMNEEIWRDIEGYEGLYMISNRGRIKALERNVKYKNSTKHLKERIRKTFIDGSGYERIELCKNGETKKYSIHRLVAEAFIKRNKSTKVEVNHINGIKTDNCVENLEWVTSSENELHAYKIGLAKISDKRKEELREWCKQNRIKSIIQLDLDGNYIKKWKSAVEVEKELGINRKCISECIAKRNKTAGGYKWELASKDEEKEEHINPDDVIRARMEEVWEK